MGPLKGVRIVEFSGLGPAPYAAMSFADLGAEVLRIVRKGAPPPNPQDVLFRGRKAIGFDLKNPKGIEAALKLIEKADALIEAFRPGVMERLGLGPDACFARNPHLVYGRMTGWGQAGPLAATACHDIDIIAISGALHAIGGRSPPLNLVGDLSGALQLCFGMTAAMLEARSSGRGQVVDAAMCDSAASATALFSGLKSMGWWSEERGTNVLDGGAHFYGVYKTADGKGIALGAIEPQFYAEMLRRAGIDDPHFAAQMDRAAWPALKEKLAAVIAQKTRAEWDAIFDGSDACYAPVLLLREAPLHPHNAARGTFAMVEGVVQPAPVPRFSRTPGQIQSPPQAADSNVALAAWDFSPDDIAALHDANAI